MLLRQTLLYLPAQIISPLIQFVSILIWAQLLGPAALGTLTLIIATQEICFAAFFGWWSRYVLRFIGSYADKSQRVAFLKSEVFAVAISVLAQSLLLWPILRHQLGAEQSLSVMGLATAFMITRSVSNYMSERARADHRIALYSLLQIAGPVIGFGVGLLLIWRYSATTEMVLLGFSIAQAIGLLIGAAMCDFGRSIGKPDLSVIRQALAFGGTVMTAYLLAIVAINIPRFVVHAELGVAAVGLFAVGYGLGLRASAFAVTLVTAGAYPLVVRKMEREGREAAFQQLAQNMTLVVLTVAPVAFGLMAVSHSVVDLFVAAPFRTATYAVLPLAALGGMFRYMRAHTTDQVFLVCLKPGYSNLIAVCDLVVAVISSYVGLKVAGLTGAALGPMAAGLATLTLSFILARTKFQFHAPVGAFAKIILSAVIMAGVVLVIPRGHSPLLLAVSVVVGGAVYVGLIALTMPKERADLLKKILGRFGAKAARSA